MKAITFLVILFLAASATAQVVPFTSDRWSFSNNEHKLTTYQGKDAVLLKKGFALLKNADFENGVIEYDVAFPQGRAFIGLRFRVQDEENFEEFYLRSHQSGNPDANQYAPVFGGNSAWQLYHGEGYSAPVKYDFDTWIHVKLVVSGKYMEAYINDMNTPIIFAELKRPIAKGGIGIQTNSETYFANLTVVQQQPELKGKPKTPEEIQTGTIEHWAVSEPFNEKNLAGITSLKALKGEMKFRSHRAENTGTLNLSSIATLSEDTNTVLAKVVIESERDQVKKIVFGFSDRVMVFVNGDLTFSGEDNFASRDYRFLGTIGYFDAVYARLKKGKNEIHFAVSESFGGWGIKAKCEDIEGIKFLY